MATLNKMNNKSKTNKKRTNIGNYNKPQKKHRLGTVSNKSLGGGRGGGGGRLNRFYARAINDLVEQSVDFNLARPCDKKKD